MSAQILYLEGPKNAQAVFNMYATPGLKRAVHVEEQILKQQIEDEGADYDPSNLIFASNQPMARKMAAALGCFVDHLSMGLALEAWHVLEHSDINSYFEIEDVLREYNL